jgi:HlyD family secretion protein
LFLKNRRSWVVNLSGVVRAEPRIAVPALVSGRVVEVSVQEGASVKKGDVICKIESDRANLNVQNAENAYQNAVLNAEIAKIANPDIAVKQAEEGVKSAEAALEIAKLNEKLTEDSDNSELQKKNAEEQVKQAQLNLENAQANLDALKKGDTSDENIEVSKLQMKNQALSLAIAQLSLKSLKEQKPTDDDIKEAEEHVKQAEINLENAKANLKQATDNPNTPDEQITILENQVKIAQSNLNIANLTLDKLKNHSTPSDEDIAQAEDRVSQAEIAYKIAEQNYESALKAKTAKEAQITQAENQVKLAESQLQIAQNNLKIAQNGTETSQDTLQIRKEQVVQAESSLENAKANLENAQLQEKTNDLRIKQAEVQESQAYVNLQLAKETLKNYTITAPCDGTVILLDVHVGDTVSPGKTVAVVGDINHLVADCFADEIDAVNIKKGQSAVISFDAFPYKTLNGTVEYVASTTTMTNQGVQAYEVKCALPKTSLNIKDGLSTTVDITTGIKKNALSVPIESVATENGKNYVILVLPDGKFEKRYVEVGISSDNYTEIVSGLKEGDKILDIPDETVFEKVETKKSPFGGKHGGG